ncbi:MAG: SMC family ATPase [Chloroflexi bacterium]|nr:SMC family ATPase [Chloroflexota bacterium]
MIPVNLQISGFLSFQEPVEVDFTGFNLACISGANGAGKSSLLDAITWVLFGKARQNDDSIINSNRDTARVVFVFKYEGETYRVTREKHKNKTGVLEFNIRAANGDWTVLTRESIRKTEALICETLRMDYDTFINASFFLQGKADQFAQKSPAERKKVLSSILGLDQWDVYRLEASERVKKVKGEIDILDGQLQEIASELSQEEQRKQKLAEEESACKEIGEKRAEKQAMVQNAQKLDAAIKAQKTAIERMEREYQATSERVRSVQSRLEELEEMIQLDQRLIQNESEITARFTEWNSIREEKNRLQEISNRYHHLTQKQNPLLAKISREEGVLRERLSQLAEKKKGIDATQAEIDRLAKSIPEQKRQLDSWQIIIDSRPELETKLQNLNAEKAHNESESKRIDTDLEALRDRFKSLRKLTGAECPFCRQTLTESHRNELLAELEKEGLALKARKETCELRVQQIEKELNSVQQQIRQCDEISQKWHTGQLAYNQDVDLLARKEQEKKDQQAAIDEEAEVRATLDSGMFAREVREENAQIEKEIAVLGFDEKELTRCATRESELRPVEAEYHDLEKAKTRLEQRLEQKKNFQLQIDETERDLIRISTELEEAKKHLSDLSNGMPDLAELTRQLDELSDQEAARLKLLGEARSRVQVLEEKRKQQKQIVDERRDKSRLLDRLKILEKAFGKSGVPALLIEEALPEIESRAREILDRLSDGSMSVQLVTQKEYKDKKREDKQETLDILISDGAGERAYELFSGGEAFRVNFAIRLALSQELAHRAGARLQTLVIDEGFGSQDSDGRQRLIETINIVQQEFEKILVITHMEELKEAFPARIEVEKTPHGSKVIVP